MKRRILTAVPLFITLFIFSVFSIFADDTPPPVPKIAYIYPAGGQTGTVFEILIGGRQLGRSGAILFYGGVNSNSVNSNSANPQTGISGRILNSYSSTRINNGDERRVAAYLYYEALEHIDPAAVSAEQKRKNAVLKQRIEESQKNSAASDSGKNDSKNDSTNNNKNNKNNSAGKSADNKSGSGEYYPAFESITRRYPYFDKLKQASPEALETVYDIYFSPRPDRLTAQDVIPQNLIAEITIDADALPGMYDLRLQGSNGLTAPVKFYVDKLPEIKEREPNDFTAKPNQAVPETWGKPLIEPPSRHGIQEIYNLPVIFNGQIRAGDADRFSFRANRGQKLVLAVRARSLMPYLADAVPGWFQAVLSLYNSEGKKITESASYRFDPDPVIFFDVPETGVYTVEVRDAIYRGREDFVYRLSAAETPVITSVFPLGGQSGSPTGVDIEGRNLPVRHSVLPTDKVKNGIYSKNILEGTVLAEPLIFAADSLPEYFEKEMVEKETVETGTFNNIPEKGENVSLPVIINGKINTEGDEDYFIFTGRQGQQIVIDVNALSLGSALDSAVQLLDESGKIIAENDDRADCIGPNIGLETHHADPYLKTVLPESGKYSVRIYSTISKGGVNQSYRLRISEPLPDFSVYTEPSALNFQNGKCIIKAHIVPKDGFDGKIDFRLTKDYGLFSIKQEPLEKRAESNKPPENETTAGSRGTENNPQVKDVQLTLTASPFRQVIPLEIEAAAELNGKKIIHTAVPSDDYEQAFIYHHWVPAKSLPAVYIRNFNRSGLK